MTHSYLQFPVPLWPHLVWRCWEQKWWTPGVWAGRWWSHRPDLWEVCPLPADGDIHHQQGPLTVRRSAHREILQHVSRPPNGWAALHQWTLQRGHHLSPSSLGCCQVQQHRSGQDKQAPLRVAVGDTDLKLVCCNYLLLVKLSFSVSVVGNTCFVPEHFKNCETKIEAVFVK